MALVGYLLICCRNKQLEREGSGEDKQMFMNGTTSSVNVPLESFLRVTAD